MICRKQVDHKSFVFFSKHYMPTMNCQLRKIRFTSETDCENSLLFFDNKIGRSNKKFIILVYCKRSTCYTGHLASDQALQFFIRRLISYKLFLNLTIQRSTDNQTNTDIQIERIEQVGLHYHIITRSCAQAR